VKQPLYKQMVVLWRLFNEICWYFEAIWKEKKKEKKGETIHSLIFNFKKKSEAVVSLKLNFYFWKMELEVIIF
jgi:hypothetical protein